MYSANDLLQLLSSGESMENALRACCKGIKIGKILIHREGDNGQQVWFINFCHVLGWVKLLRSKFLCSSSIKIYQKILQIGMFCCWTPYWEQVRFLFLFSGRPRFSCQLNLIKNSNHSSMHMSTILSDYISKIAVH